jgi:hypothetical protein
MKRLAWMAALVAVLASTLLAGSAGAIRFGQPDGSQHPYVGLVGFYDSDGNWLWRCTGTLVEPDVVVTAGHCTGLGQNAAGEWVEPARAQVWFDPGPITPEPLNPNAYPNGGGDMGTPHPDPGWNGSLTIPNTHDIGVVVLDHPVTMPEYGKMAPLGTLDKLAAQRGKQDVSFTVVGYGLQSEKPKEVGVRQRMVATVTLQNLRSQLTDGYNVQYSGDPGNGNGPGGTCFGDSGGPVFYGGLVVAVNSFVMNANCQGPGFGFRTDTQPALSFLAGYGVTP